MSKNKKYATYINNESALPIKTKNVFSGTKTLLSAIIAVIVLALSLQPLIQNDSTKTEQNIAQADAFVGIFCVTSLGVNMDAPGSWNAFLNDPPSPEASRRTWTLQEAFSSNMLFVNYEGEQGAESKSWIQDKKNRDKVLSKYGNYSEHKGKFEKQRSVQTCVNGLMSTAIPSAMFSINVGISHLTQNFAKFAFNTELVCADPANPSGGCFNLLKIIGGTNDSSKGGIIGILTTGIYMPLIFIAIAVSALWLLKIGLFDQKYSQAFMGAVWLVLAFVFGLALLLNPSLLAKAPMAVTNTVGNCIIGGFTGQNCFDNSKTNTSNAIASSNNDVCKSDASVSDPSKKMGLTINSLGCSIWKAFILEPYSQAQFGSSFADLDVYDGKIAKAVEKSGIPPETFCVNLGSSKSVNNQGNVLQLDREYNKVCNLAAYQMYLSTSATSGDDGRNGTGPDDRWYNVIVAAANDTSVWRQWAPGFTETSQRVTVVAFSGIATLLGSIIILITAFFASAYYLGSIVLMAFAPLFFLLGLHPGRGKSLLFGWLSQVLGAIMKYIASAFFLIITIAFYGGILGSVSNVFVLLIFVIIISGALFMYRKEIVSMIGRVNMTGEKLSSRFVDKIQSIGDRSKKLGVNVAGSAIGAAIASDDKHRATAAFAGARDGIMRDLKRGGGFIGNTARQLDRSSMDNKSDLNTERLNAQREAEVAEKEYNENVQEFENTQKEFDTNNNDKNENLSQLEAMKEEYEKYVAAKEEVHEKMRPQFGSYVQLQELLDKNKLIELKVKVAKAQGDDELVDSLREDQRKNNVLIRDARKNVSSLEEARGSQQYERYLNSVKKRDDISFDDNSYVELGDKMVQDIKFDQEIAREIDHLNELSQKLTENEIEKEQKQNAYKMLNDEYINWKPGQIVTSKDVQKIVEKSKKPIDTGDVDFAGNEKERSEIIEQLRKKANASDKKLYQLVEGKISDDEGGNKGTGDVPERPVQPETKPERRPETKPEVEPETRRSRGNTQEPPVTTTPPVQKPQRTPEVQPEAQPVQPETKPETKPEVKPETKPETRRNRANTQENPVKTTPPAQKPQRTEENKPTSSNPLDFKDIANKFAEGKNMNNSNNFDFDKNKHKKDFK